jgi:hypothetical protein
MKVSSILKEIEVVEHMIVQNRKCLVIFHKAKMYEEFRVTLNDLQVLKIELQRLNHLIKDKVKNTAKDIKQGEPTSYGAGEK